MATLTEGNSLLRATLTEAGPDGTISGIAAAYDIPVQRGADLFELIRPGAFRGQLSAANRIPILWGHDHDSPIGRATRLSDSAERLTFTAKISENEDIPEARRALALLREGVVDELSVGFEWGTWSRTEAGDRVTYEHTKARLREISVVTFGALGREARVVTVNSEQVAWVAARRAALHALNS